MTSGKNSCAAKCSASGLCSGEASDAVKLDQCAVGDVSGQTGLLLRVGSVVDPGIPVVAAAVSLPLSGDYAVLGRTIVLNGANRGMAPVACGSIAAVVSPTSFSAIARFNEREYISFSQESLGGPTTIRVSVGSISGGRWAVYQGTVGSDGNVALIGDVFNPAQ